MNRLLLAAAGAIAMTGLAGCPVYSNAQSYRVCDSQGCFLCPDHGYSSNCTAACEGPQDCPRGSACALSGECVPMGVTPNPAGSCSAPSDCGSRATCGADNFCHAGDCGSGVGCTGGYTCTLVAGVAQCLGPPPDASPPDAESLDAFVQEAGLGDAPESGPVDGATCIDGSCQ
jgi:hypothetical protein